MKSVAMGIVLIFFGCFILYAKSKHIPDFLSKFGDRLRTKPTVTRIAAYFLFLLAVVVLGNSYGFWTGLLIFLMVLMFTLMLTLILLPLNKKYAYFIAALSIIAILTEYLT
ncbi:MAG: hypothetical protein AAGH81_15070 [Bacteroidota bacterium]